MKPFVFPCILCLCWLMISCSSTPPVEESLPEEVIPEQVLEQSSSQIDPEPELMQIDDGALISTDFPLVQESESLDEFTPIANEPLSLEPNVEAVPQTDSQDYLQEIEIIDLIQDQDVPSPDNQEDMAVIVEEDKAVVVELSADVNEEIPLPSVAEAVPAEEAVVVELIQEEIAEPVLPEPDPEVIMATVVDTPESVTPETEVVELAVPEPVATEPLVMESEELEQVPSEPVDINATQGVLEDFVVPSRSVVMDKEQYLDIRYPGTGWVYLGEVTKEGNSIGTPSLTYFGRRRTSEDTSFTMKSTKPGTTILHFYKQDVLSATFIDDFLEVTITDKVAQNGFRVIAPNYETIVPGYQDTIPQPQDFVTEIAQEIPQEIPQDTSQNDAPVESSSPVVPSQQQAVATQNKPVTQSAPAISTTAPTTTVPAVRETASSNVASTTSAPATGETATTARPVTTTAVPRESSPAATVIVPPQTSSKSSAARNSPAQVSTLQQETYQPELPANTPSQDNFNPETGMSMENMDLPWVSQELERQRTADMSTSALKEAPKEADSGQQQAQEMLLAQAQDYFYAEDYPAALETLNKFFEIAVSDFDAGYYLKGQVLESKSSIKNVKEAQKAYKHVIDSYPQSPFWERAKNRYTYLSRFYFDIR